MTALALAPAEAERGDVARWSASFAAILALHALVVAGIALTRGAVVEPGEALPAIMIDMAPPPSAPTAAPAVTQPSEMVPEAAAPTPVAEAPPDMPEPEIAPTIPPPEAMPMPAAVVQESATVALPPPVRRAPPVERKVEAKKPPKAAQAKRAERQEARRPPAVESGAQTTASIPATSSGSSAASRASWQGAIVAALNRAKRPQTETGLASVRFSIDRGGRVLTASVAGSAGASALDQEAVGLVRRASLPPAPPDVAGGSFTFTVPIRFTTR